MAVRRSKYVAQFLRAAGARLDEAVVLRTQGYSLGAVYLVGYAVECGLKALILS